MMQNQPASHVKAAQSDGDFSAGSCQRSLHARTPLIESAAMTRALDLPGCKVWLKLENCQPTGSFKIRGIGCMVQRAVVQSGCKWVVSSSGGNAGLAAAYAANRLGLGCTVVVPVTTPERMRQRIADEGAEVLVHGNVWLEAHTRAEALAANERPASILVHPYDHPDVWRGHSSLIDEVFDEGLRPDAIVVAVGGGGLLCGIVDGLRRRSAHLSVPVFAAETVGANCLAAALASREPVTLASITSKATSLGASRVCQGAWEAAIDLPVRSVVCTDAEAAVASLRFLEEHLMLTELACGAALSVLYQRRIQLEQLLPSQLPNGERNILVVVCGGRNVSVDQLSHLA